MTVATLAPAASMSSVGYGIIYAYLRGDLGKVYVGQTKRPTQRMRRHLLGEDSYVMEELSYDGEAPEYIVVLKNVPFEELDAAERDVMRTYLHLGWNLINHLGPDAHWPYVPTEVVRRLGQTHGPKRAAFIHEQRAVDAEFDAWWRGVARSGNAALRAKRADDPEFDAYCREREQDGLQKGAEVRRVKRASDSAWAERERLNNQRAGLVGGRNGGLATASRRFECLVCGRVSTPGGIGMHQKSSGHSGKADVTNNPLLGKG